MFDNGLLKYFPKDFTSEGCLDLSNLHFEMEYGNEEYSFLNFLRCKEGRFFCKYASKEFVDAEVLGSQIFRKAGLNSALYIPAKSSKGTLYAVSNDVIGTQNIIAFDHMQILREQLNTEFPLSMPNKKKDNLIDYSKIITKDAMRDVIKMRYFDVAYENPDRHESNYALKVENGIITAVYMFDFGESANKLERGYLLDYYHDFEFKKNSLLSDLEMLLMARENENLQDYISCSELAENIGSINVSAIASDIKSTIGYEIGGEFIDQTARKFDYVAEGLVCSEEKLLDLYFEG